MLLSSLASHLGGLQHGGYAAANRYLDAFAMCRADRPGTRWISLGSEQWSLDAGGLAPAEQALPAAVAGMAMSVAEGLEVIDRVLAGVASGNVLVSTVDLNARHAHWSLSAGDDASETQEAPTAQVARQGIRVAPRNRIEARLAELWGEFLGLRDIGIEDDFFQLGGHSILAIRIMARARAEGIPLAPVDLLSNPTIARLNALVEARPPTGAIAETAETMP
jgi:aryl carrier-like protein